MTDSILPEPLVEPGTCVPRNFQFMRLDVGRLLDSEFWHTVSFEARGVAMGLWLAAFRQTPGGSLPDNDEYLASLVGLGKTKASVRKWLKLKTEAMHGFTLCSDGRWYHPVVVEEVLHIWNGRSAQEYRSREDNDPRAKDRERLRRWRAKQKEAKLAAAGNETGETKRETPVKRINETVETLQETDKDKEEDKEVTFHTFQKHVSGTLETETPNVTHTLPENTFHQEVSAPEPNKDRAYNHQVADCESLSTHTTGSQVALEDRNNPTVVFVKKEKNNPEEKNSGSLPEKSFSENGNNAAKPTTPTGAVETVDSPKEGTREGVLCKELRKLGIRAAPHMEIVREMCGRHSDEHILAAAELALERKGSGLHVGYIAAMLKDTGKPGRRDGNSGTQKGHSPPNRSLLPPLAVEQSRAFKL
ncbi:DUF1376 domain-containing protein [Acidithiobacillus thiooxidans]|nr:DUF1376 domain-containing protein [Acidithiobacillus thiooxidans]MDA8175728.1 DUF1376 domain-containing protein [Acidithiobacillus sp.]